MRGPAIEWDLAAEGGAPVRTEPFSPWPYFYPGEIESAISVLRSGQVNYHTGDEGKQFEKEFAAYTGCKHGIALMNGTVALELALYALGVGPGDEVIVPSRTFIATASCAIVRGATPIFADIDIESQNITAQSIRAVITPRSKAIIVVHHAGWPCEMDTIMELAREFNLRVIEDCAQCHGATYKNKPVGSFGDVAAFSFCQDKIMTTAGEGGMLVTNSEALWERAWSFKDHGKSYDAMYIRYHPPGFRWVHESIGTNWRMTEVQSAMGRVLLRSLDGSVAIRRANGQVLSESFSKIDALRVTIPPSHVQHAYYKYYVFIRPERLRPGWTRDRIQAAISAEGIPCIVGGCSEIYLEKAFAPELRPQARLEVASRLADTALMFMVHPTMSNQELADTLEAVQKVMRVASL